MATELSPGPAGSPTVLVYAHHDVQPAGPGELWEGKSPVGVAVFIEGEERIGSVHLPQFLSEYGGLLCADAIVLANFSNWNVGQPTLTTSLRGILDCLVEVRTLEAFRRACGETWGRAPVEPGSGGSLPLLAAMAAAYPDTAMLLTGVKDPESNAHSEKRERAPRRASELLRQLGNDARPPGGGCIAQGG